MGNIWGIQQLVPHPQTPGRTIESVGAQLLSVDPHSIEIGYHVFPALSLMLPQQAEPRRADGLWKSTCFEAFLKADDSDSYVELNFSPSFCWAAYAFHGYRAGLRRLPVALDPEIAISPADRLFYLSAEFERPLASAARVMMNLSAVIEETDGTKSYWALAHPPKGPPDFHDPACFVLELPPASEA